MSTALVLSAFAMGLAGGPHCAAMCGAACAGLARPAPSVQGVRFAHAENRRLQARPPWAFHLGRLAGYSTAGAVAAAAMDTFAWLTSGTAALQPVWTLLHVAMLLWGITLLVLARQPVWATAAGRGVWARVRDAAQGRRGQFALGVAWTLLPCGLLYSALLLAALSGGPLQGALAMALFALGSGAWLVLGPWLVLRLQANANANANAWRERWGTRAAGALLAAAAVAALWMDTAERIAQWCR
jgi:sulfite exporter TauE/SafE